MKLSKILLTLILSMFISTGVIASNQDIQVVIDGSILLTDIPPLAINNRTMVPMRAIFEAMDAEVEWDNITRSITGVRGKKKISLQLDNPKANINGIEVILDSPPLVINERTLVPIRFISESLGAKVEWDKETRTVFINERVNFKDINLERVIRNEINKPYGYVLNSDLEEITSLKASREAITSLEGIEHLKNLEQLYLDDNKISDISPLLNLTKLEYVVITGNDIKDYKNLEDLVSLELVRDHDDFSIETEVLELVNKERKNHGLAPLKISHKLSKVAQIKSQDMVDNNYFDHTSPIYGSPFNMMESFGITYRTAGENIAVGYPTSQKVMDAWMNSPGHRSNILSSGFGTLGVGYAYKNGAIYWTQMFTN